MEFIVFQSEDDSVEDEFHSSSSFKSNSNSNLRSLILDKMRESSKNRELDILVEEEEKTAAAQELKRSENIAIMNSRNHLKKKRLDNKIMSSAENVIISDLTMNDEQIVDRKLLEAGQGHKFNIMQVSNGVISSNTIGNNGRDDEIGKLRNYKVKLLLEYV